MALPRGMACACTILCHFVLPADSVRLEANAMASMRNQRGHGPEDVDPTEVRSELVHVAMRPCLMHYANQHGVSVEVAQLWELDLKLNVLDPDELEGIAKLMKDYERMFAHGQLSYFDVNDWPAERRTLMQEEYHDLDAALRAEYFTEKFPQEKIAGQFQYEETRQMCRDHVQQVVLPRFEAFKKELTEGCSGWCCKAWNGCHESDETFCPEGTRCRCQYKGESLETRAKVAAGTFFLVWSINTVVFWGYGGWLYPGPMEATLASLFVFASRTVGCTCMPLQCHWDAEKNACQVERQLSSAELADELNHSVLTQVRHTIRPWDFEPWGQNRHISSVPLTGFKCEPYMPMMYTGRNLVEAQNEPTCELKACALEDYMGPGQENGVTGLIGTVGEGVYNCWQLLKQDEEEQPGDPNAYWEGAIPSYALEQGRRLQIYDEVFPPAADPGPRHREESMTRGVPSDSTAP